MMCLVFSTNGFLSLSIGWTRASDVVESDIAIREDLRLNSNAEKVMVKARLSPYLLKMFF